MLECIRMQVRKGALLTMKIQFNKLNVCLFHTYKNSMRPRERMQYVFFNLFMSDFYTKMNKN